jgi:hypothetical protein
MPHVGAGEAVQHPSTLLAPGAQDWCFRENQYGNWLPIQVPYSDNSFRLLHCNFESCGVRGSPDWAVTMIEAVPRFGCVLLPYPPQPLSVSDSATDVSAAVTISSEARAWNNLGPRPLPTQKLSIVHTFASELVPKIAR